MSAWFNYEATGKILVFGLLAGAALPALFALGVRLYATGSGGSVTPLRSAPRPVLIVISWAIFALVLTVIASGVLYIARDFIAGHLGFLFCTTEPAVAPHSV